jgi:hypothetical protein
MENRTMYQLNEWAWDVLVIQKKTFLMLNFSGRNLTVRGKDLNVIKVVSKINNKPLKPFGGAIGDNNTVYISDLHNDRLIMTNFQCEETLAETSGKFYGISFRNSLLFACETHNNRIKIFDADLKNCKIFSVDYYPWLIKVTEYRICVKALPIHLVASFKVFDGKCITSASIPEAPLYFYDTTTFNFVCMYDRSVGRISEIGLKFYEWCDSKRILYCYNEQGVWDDKIELDYTEYKNIYRQYTFNGCLVMSDGFLCVTGENKFYKFSDIY